MHGEAHLYLPGYQVRLRWTVVPLRRISVAMARIRVLVLLFLTT